MRLLQLLLMSLWLRSLITNNWSSLSLPRTEKLLLQQWCLVKPAGADRQVYSSEHLYLQFPVSPHTHDTQLFWHSTINSLDWERNIRKWGDTWTVEQNCSETCFMILWRTIKPTDIQILDMNMIWIMFWIRNLKVWFLRWSFSWFEKWRVESVVCIFSQEPVPALSLYCMILRCTNLVTSQTCLHLSPC